jgi:hypothetical protein
LDQGIHPSQFSALLQEDRDILSLHCISKCEKVLLKARQSCIVKLARGCEDIYISMEKRQNLQLQVSKLNALRKRRLGTFVVRPS